MIEVRNLDEELSQLHRMIQLSAAQDVMLRGICNPSLSNCGFLIHSSVLSSYPKRRRFFKAKINPTAQDVPSTFAARDF